MVGKLRVTGRDPEVPTPHESLAGMVARAKEAGSAQRSTTISLQSGILGHSEGTQSLSYPSEIKRKRVVGLEGFEPPTHGLGNLFGRIL